MAHAVSFFLFIILTGVFTRPLWIDLSGSLIGGLGDNLYFVWVLWWFATSLFEFGSSPLFVPDINYPQGWEIARNEMVPVLALLGLPVTLLGGPVLGYNVILMMTYLLSAGITYYWVFRLTSSRVAALFAGLVFAFSPYRVAHSLGHLNLLGTMWLPLYFMFLHQMVVQPSWRQGMICGLSLGLLAGTSQYYLYMAVILSVPFGLMTLWTERARLGTFRELSPSLIGLLATAVPLVALACAPYLKLAGATEFVPRPYQEVRNWSAGITDYLIPPVLHPWWGGWVARHFDRTAWIESTLYIGVLPILLAVIGAVKQWRQPLVKVLVVSALISLVLSFGTTLTHFNQPVRVAWGSDHFDGDILLPGYFLYTNFPYYALIRVPMRYAAFVQLFIAILAGVGVVYVLANSARIRQYILGGIILLLTLLEFMPTSLPVSPVAPRAVDHWLAQQERGGVAELPFGRLMGASATHATRFHGQPFIGSFSAGFLPKQIRRHRRAIEAFPARRSVEALRTLGVRWLVLDRAMELPDPTRQQELGIVLRASFPEEQVFELLPVAKPAA